MTEPSQTKDTGQTAKTKTAGTLPVPVAKTITVSSDEGGWFGKLKVRIKVSEVTDDDQKINPSQRNYKIARDEWNATLGPIFNRVVENFGGKARYRDDTYAIAVGYKAMRNDSYGESQTRSFHQLWQSFSAAADPAYLESFRTLEFTDGHREENPYGKKLQRFADVWNKEDSVLVTETQLKALANIAKGAADWAFSSKQNSREHIAQMRDFYKKHIKDNPKISY